MADAAIRFPPVLEINYGNVAETFKNWKDLLDIYMLASGSNEKPKKVQRAIILNCAGPQVVKIAKQFVYANDDEKDDPDVLLRMIEQYCNPRQNEVMETFRFWKVEYSSPFDAFLADMREKIVSCNFRDPDRMLRDKIIFSVEGKLQQILLREDRLTLDKTIQICRGYETACKNTNELQASTTMVNKLDIKKKKETYLEDRKKHFVDDCKFCGRSHQMGSQFCPAYGKLCHKCQGRNHFKNKCNARRQQKIHEIQDHDQSNDDEAYLNAMKNEDKRTLTASLYVNNCKVQFQVDTGAEVNIICQRYVRKEQVTPTTRQLVMWNNSKEKPVGETVLSVTNLKTNSVHDIKFIVVKNHFNCLLGLETSKKLNLITVNDDCFVANFCAKSDFGDLGTVTLQVDDNVKPKILPSRNIPLALQSKVKLELDHLVECGMSKDIKQIADNCHICQELKPSNQKESLRQHDECSYPWEKCGVDIFELSGKMYLVVVDYFSFFFEIDVLTSTTASNVIHCMKKHFARYGIPKIIVSDCGSQFMSCEFKKLCDKWHITHITSSPDHQRENGKAEAAVKAAKHLLKQLHIIMRINTWLCWN